MVQSHSASDWEQVVDTMVGLTHLTYLHRAIIAGSSSMEIYLALRRRGFLRLATTATCPVPKGQHSIGLIAGHNSLQAIETALAEISPFLSTSAAIAVLIDSLEIGAGLRIREKLERLGFWIEAGVRCQEGFVLSAFRRGVVQMEKAA